MKLSSHCTTLKAHTVEFYCSNNNFNSFCAKADAQFCQAYCSDIMSFCVIKPFCFKRKVYKSYFVGKQKNYEDFRNIYERSKLIKAVNINRHTIESSARVKALWDMTVMNMSFP